MRKKFITVAVAALLLFCVVGGTIAWLKTQTGAVVNTFTAGDINITLMETKREYKMVPGITIEKDPKVTVEAGSEDCWLFVKVDKTDNFDNFMEYEMADGWIELSDADGVWYREVKTTDTEQGFFVLKNNQVTVKSGVTKAMLNNLNDTTYPQLTFTAYAIQQAQFTDANVAWIEAQALDAANLNP